MVYWAQDVGGSFTASNAQAAWSQAMGFEATTHGTLSSTAEVPDRTAYRPGTANHFLLMGWENLNTHTGGWIAARFNHTSSQLVRSGPWYKSTWNIVTHTTMDWMANGNPGRVNVEGPLTLNFTTNHYTVGLYISPDSRGHVNGSFTTPHLQPPPAS